MAFPVVSTSTIAPRTDRPAIHPSAKAGPFARARGVASMSTIAIMGIGLIATTTANGRMFPIA